MAIITADTKIVTGTDVGHKIAVVNNFKAALSNLQHTLINTMNPFMRERIQQKIAVVEREIMAQ